MRSESDHAYHFKARGKLLLSGEYLVLKGALALGLPLQFGQSLQVRECNSKKLEWLTFTGEKEWFRAEYSRSFDVLNSSDKQKAETIRNLFIEAKKMNPAFASGNGYQLESRMDFQPEWGFGSSSSLVANIAAWAKVDAFELNQRIFGGSGYDIACAGSNGPLSYQLTANKRIVKPVSFNPSFSNKLYFIWLGHKQNSRDGIARIEKDKSYTKEVEQCTAITRAIIACKTFDEFVALLEEHEELIADTIQEEPIGKKLFPEFKGVVKSLGAWGGDFILAASNEPEKDVFRFFREQNYATIFKYAELIR